MNLHRTTSSPDLEEVRIAELQAKEAFRLLVRQQIQESTPIEHRLSDQAAVVIAELFALARDEICIMSNRIFPESVGGLLEIVRALEEFSKRSAKKPLKSLVRLVACEPLFSERTKFAWNGRRIEAVRIAAHTMSPEDWKRAECHIITIDQGAGSWCANGPRAVAQFGVSRQGNELQRYFDTVERRARPQYNLGSFFGAGLT